MRPGAAERASAAQQRSGTPDDVGVAPFYTYAVAIAVVAPGDRPADPARIAADFFPAIEQVYAEEGAA
jgi:hypothetical protein